MGIESMSSSASAVNAYQHSTNHVKNEHASDKTSNASTDEKHSSDSVEISENAKKATKGMDVDQLKSLQDAEVASFKNMLASMLNRQAGTFQKANGNTLEISKALFHNLTVTPEEAQQATDAISENGEWGVNAVAGRIMDMAMALSGGDTSKMETLKNAVAKGFGEATRQWGDKLPSICQETHEEINKQFDYWKENGSLDGYTKEKAE